ncbi:MAG: universal stress protein [Anaerolineae bacterium]
MFKKILVPLDGSKLAESALEHAEKLAKAFETELIVIRVLQAKPEVIAGPRALVSHEPEIQEQREAEIYLNRVRGKLRGHQLPARILLLKEQPPAQAIVGIAYQEKVDLIVMSTRPHAGLSRLMHSSVAEEVLRHAPCPIFLIRATSTG